MSIPISIPKLLDLPGRRSQLRIRIRALVFERFDDFVEQHCEQRAADGADPVDPLRGVEVVDGDGGAEGAGGVEGAAGPEDAWGMEVRCVVLITWIFWARKKSRMRNLRIKVLMETHQRARR